MERGVFSGEQHLCFDKDRRKLQTGTIRECKMRKQLDTERGFECGQACSQTSQWKEDEDLKTQRRGGLPV